MKISAKHLRELSNEEAREKEKNIKRHQIFLILEDVLDTYNVGGIFRLADAIAAEKIFLCGQTEYPPNPKITKASIGTYKVVPWEYKNSAAEAVTEIRKISGMQIVAVEQHEKSRDYRKIDYRLPLALILGNETYGIKEKTLLAADAIAEVPMYGVNTSLNVIVAAGIVAYRALGQIDMATAKLLTGEK